MSTDVGADVIPGPVPGPGQGRNKRNRRRKNNSAKKQLQEQVHSEQDVILHSEQLNIISNENLQNVKKNTPKPRVINKKAVNYQIIPNNEQSSKSENYVNLNTTQVQTLFHSANNADYGASIVQTQPILKRPALAKPSFGSAGNYAANTAAYYPPAANYGQIMSLMGALSVNNTVQTNTPTAFAPFSNAKFPDPNQARTSIYSDSYGAPQGQYSDQHPPQVVGGAIRRPPKAEKAVKPKKEKKKIFNKSYIVINNSNVDHKILPPIEQACTSSEHINAVVQSFTQEKSENQRLNKNSLDTGVNKSHGKYNERQNVAGLAGRNNVRPGTNSKAADDQQTMVQRVRNRSNKKPCKQKLHVTGYPYGTTKQQLQDVFENFGPITVEIFKIYYATVVCGSANKRDAALEKEFKLNGIKLTVQPDRPFGARHANKEDVLPKPSQLDLSGDPAQQLNSFLAAVRLQFADLHNIMELLHDVEVSLRPEFSKCEAMPFGSLSTGLGVRGSDADCYVRLHGAQREMDQRLIVNKACRLLRKRNDIFSEVIAIPQAHTPIVKLFHRPTSTPVDVTFKTRLGVRNSALVAHLFRRDARLTALAVVVKYWAVTHQLTGSGKLSNYALTMLIIFYLQHIELLLPIAEMQSLASPHVVDGWDTGFEDRIAVPNLNLEPEDDHTVHSLIGEFFGFYAAYDLDGLVVCPFLGRPIRKSTFKNPSDLPEEFHRYKSNVSSGASRPLRVRRPLVVQDPFEQCQNVASAISYKQAYIMQQYFSIAYDCYLEHGDSSRFLPLIFKNVPELRNIKLNFHPEFKLTFAMQNKYHYFPWMDRFLKAVKLVFEDCLQLDLERINHKVKDMPDEKYMTYVDYQYWDRSEVYKEAGVAGLPLVARERGVSARLRALPQAPPSVCLQASLLLAAHEPAASADLTMRLTEGDPQQFNDFHTFMRKHVVAWINELMYRPQQAGWDVAPLELRASK